MNKTGKKKSGVPDPRWDKAIRVIEEKLREEADASPERIEQLDSAIRTLQAQRDYRQPWPTESATQS